MRAGIGSRLRGRLGWAVVGVVGVVVSTLAGAPPAGAGEPPSLTTVLENLNAPRGVAFDRQGSMYVVESGVIGPSGANGLTHSGTVSKYRRGSTTPLWSTIFESLYLTPPGSGPSQPPDVLGPEGISVAGNGCNGAGGDRGDRDTSCAIRLIMSESHNGVAAESDGAILTKDAGHLYGLNPVTGNPTDLSDVGDQQYLFTRRHKDLFPPDFPDSNPYGVLVTGGDDHQRNRTFVADAGANTVSEIMPGGRTRVIAYIPNETVAPFRDATPTCIAQGPDGMLYVATLHFVANLSGSGQSDVWRVDPNAKVPAAPQLWASGLTTPTACTFDRKGNFWATEMFQPTTGAPGDVVRIPFKYPKQLTRVGGGTLPLPGGIAQAPNGDIYVSINSANPEPGSGAIVRIGN